MYACTSVQSQKWPTLKFAAISSMLLVCSRVEGPVLDDYMSKVLDRTPKQYVDTVIHVLKRLLQVCLWHTFQCLLCALPWQLFSYFMRDQVKALGYLCFVGNSPGAAKHCHHNNSQALSSSSVGRYSS